MTIRLAFLPLTDAAPLVVAKETGLFERHGLDVELSREASWASVRDKLQTGRVDGAQLLATLPLSLSLGATHAPIPLATALVLSLNGNAITLSENLLADLRLSCGLAEDAGHEAIGAALRQLVQRRRAVGKSRLCFGSVYLTSTHGYALRYWLASCGIHPVRDVRLVVIPPSRMVEALASGLVDGCCVGEPWNHRAQQEGVGRIVLASHEIHNNLPEKVLAVRRDWMEAQPEGHQRLLMALIEAGQWIEQAGHVDELAALLSRPEYVDVPAASLRHSLAGEIAATATAPGRPMPDFHVFSRNAANFPWRSHAAWFLSQMMRWGHVPDDIDVAATCITVYRTDLYRDAAGTLGMPVPTSDHKPEGDHGASWDLDGLALGADRFIDGARFDATDVTATVARQRAADQALLDAGDTGLPETLRRASGDA